MIALPLLARELLGHRLGRKLRGPGTLSPDPRECSLKGYRYLPDLNPRTRPDVNSECVGADVIQWLSYLTSLPTSPSLSFSLCHTLTHTHTHIEHT